MTHGHPHSSETPANSLEPLAGWHCRHLYYTFDRGVLAALGADLIHAGRAELIATLDPGAPHAPQRLQTSVVSGHKADFGLLLLDAHPLRIDAIHQRLMAGLLGPALRPTYSFVSMTEISEYVPTVEQFSQKLLQQGDVADSPAFKAKVKAYESRLPVMNRQRLTPDLPPYPATCFYPMNKQRQVGENWFTLPFSARNRMMAEHARSGLEFAGKVSQLITVGVGFEDWEWGVTLWARNPQFLKDIVYRMRFDEASARFAEFGPFYTSYVMSAAEMLDHCRIGTATG
jgi:chlorite dismutase